MDILDFIQRNGDWFYVITFVWTFFEGETFVIFAGYASRLDILQLEVLIAVAWLGSFCGDNLYFYIGRRWGTSLLTRFPRLKPGVELALAWLRRYNTGFILSFRFIYAVRNFSSFAMGMSGIAWPRFMALNFIAAGTWACTFAGAGYLFGAALENVIEDAAKAFTIGMLCLFALVIGFTVLMHRKSKAASAAVTAAMPPAGAPAAPAAVDGSR